MKTINKTYILLATIIMMISCNDYLDVDPVGFVVPSTIEHLDLLLNSEDISRSGDDNLYFFSADDFDPKGIDVGNFTNPNDANLKFVKWDKDLFNLDFEPRAWNKPYANIYTYNLVLNKIEAAETSSTYNETDRNRIRAEAKVGRAFEYYLLVNTFGKHYSSSSSTDLGVPLVLHADVSAKTPPRSTVKEIYDFIIKDVEAAIEFLPTVRANNIRQTKASGYGYLARFYLAMGNYEKALTNANLALYQNSEIRDYNGDINQAHKDEQYVWSYSLNLFGFVKGTLSTEITDLYNESTGDLRLSKLFNNCAWTYTNTGWQYLCEGPLSSAYAIKGNRSVSVSEMVLIKAECNARLASGSITDVVSDLNLLRSKRFSTTDYVALTNADFTDKKEALAFVLKERRRELVMTGMRLFDLKRLNLEPEFAKTTIHTAGTETYTLDANANNWVMPIPSQVINLNPEIIQNQRD